jgi:lipopolysaccharide export system protein LptA
MAESPGPNRLRARSDRAEVLMARQPDTVRTAVFTGNVQVDRAGAQSLHASAGRVVAGFTGKNQIATVHAEQNVKLTQHQPGSSSSAAQDLELRATAVEAFFTGGHHLSRAETLGPNPQIAIRSSGSGAGQQTLVDAARFQAGFDQNGRLVSVHGEPDARITTTTPGQPDRVSSSRTLDAKLRPGAGIETIVQEGEFAYVDRDRKAWADRARYTPSDQNLVLSGSPRVVEQGMTTVAQSMRLNRTTGDAFADGDVKSTYSQLKPQPNGALLASGDPIHVTASSMIAHRSPAIATYTGDARLWQNANIIEAPSIQFDRDHRSVNAQAANGRQVSTVLVQVDKSGKATPVMITSARLIYADSERKASFAGGVVVTGADATLTAKQADVFLASKDRQSSTSNLPAPAQLDRIIAEGNVVITQPKRRASGDRLVYTSAEDKFVLTGGPPSIFDAEHGKITGVSLTFFRHDDRVLVEGNDTSPTVTQTRVAR